MLSLKHPRHGLQPNKQRKGYSKSRSNKSESRTNWQRLKRSPLVERRSRHSTHEPRHNLWPNQHLPDSLKTTRSFLDISFMRKQIYSKKARRLRQYRPGGQGKQRTKSGNRSTSRTFRSARPCPKLTSVILPEHLRWPLVRR